MTIQLNDRITILSNKRTQIKFHNGMAHTIEISQDLGRDTIIISPFEALELSRYLSDFAEIYFRGLQNEVFDFASGMKEFQGEKEWNGDGK